MGLLRARHARFYLKTCDGNARARTMFERAIERDPNYADAWARLGWTYLRDIGNGCTDDRDGALARGFEAARREGRELYLAGDGHYADGGARLAARVLAEYVAAHSAP